MPMQELAWLLLRSAFRHARRSPRAFVSPRPNRRLLTLMYSREERSPRGGMLRGSTARGSAAVGRAISAEKTAPR